MACIFHLFQIKHAMHISFDSAQNKSGRSLIEFHKTTSENNFINDETTLTKISLGKPHNPEKNDPFKEDEKDNDPTRIKPEKENPDKTEPAKPEITPEPTPPQKQVI
jgi:hypothetical protein